MTQQQPFYFLHNLVNLLVVEDDEMVIDLLQDILRPITLYSLQICRTAAEGLRILSSQPRIHLCLTDLGITDQGNDEFFLIKRFHTTISFLIFTGRSSPLKGFRAHSLGAKDIVEKGPSLKREHLIQKLNHYSLLHIINPHYDASSETDSLSLATRILFQDSPQLVSEWAQKMNTTDRTLRNIWTKNLGANAKIILATYHIFSAAFKYYEQFVSSNQDAKPLSPQQLSEEYQIHNYTYLEEFFFLHKRAICDFISYGMITAGR